METCSKEDFAYHQHRRKSKQVRDNVNGYIYLNPISLQFVDNEQFQSPASDEFAACLRLRDLKQLGLTYMVYPEAVHSRFEHSLGVCWQANEAVHRIKAHQGLELDINNFYIKTVRLAGLLHDVGHGPFSHLFEKEFLPPFLNGFKWSHEDMPMRMIDNIVDTHNIDIEPDCLKKVKEMVTASTEQTSQTTTYEKRFLYDIVANGRNGIGVDKFDYLVRDSRACGLGCSFQFERLMDTMHVIKDDICYRDTDYITVHKLFSTCADIHRTVYTHAKAIELMVVDALSRANDYLEISSSIHDPAKFWKIDDSILKSIETSPCEGLKEARNLILRIRRRDLYQFCNKYSVPKDNLDNFKDVTAQDIVCSQNSGGVTLKEEDVAVSIVKIYLTRGRNNPLNSVNFFEDYESMKKFPIQDDLISHLLPTSFQDKIVRVYAKNPQLMEEVSATFENFQLKTYGRIGQVHSTPVKKIMRKLQYQ